MDFIASAFSHPTTFSHAVPQSFGGLGWPANGPGFNPSNFQSGLGNIPITSRGSTHYGNGFASANANINYSLLQEKREDEDKDGRNMMADSLVFIQTYHPIPKGTDHYRTVTYVMMNLSSINSHMKHDPNWRSRYGSNRSINLFMKEYSFYGAQIGDGAVSPGEHGAMQANAQCFTVGQRARIFNICAMLDNDRGQRGPVKCLDQLYLVARRYKYTKEIDIELGIDPVLVYSGLGKRKTVDVSKSFNPLPVKKKSTTPIIQEYYWQWVPVVCVNNTIPACETYMKDDIIDPDNDLAPALEQGFNGTYIHIGKIWGLYGDARASINARLEARDFVLPSATGNGYKEFAKEMSFVDLTIRSC